jgi:hypothetical protein
VNDQKVLNIKVLMAIALLKLALEKNTTATALLEEAVNRYCYPHHLRRFLALTSPVGLGVVVASSLDVLSTILIVKSLGN